MTSVTLKAGKDKAVRNRHHWIFSGAIAHFPECEEGAILDVYSSGGDLLGAGYFTRRGSIAGRMLSFDDTPPLEAVKASIASAVALRKRLFDTKVTNAYRLINGEGDSLPGLIADLYGDVVVIQISTAGMDRLREVIVDAISETAAPRAIYEKSGGSARRSEGLSDVNQVLKGQIPDRVEAHEGGYRFFVDVVGGQKTGFFLDQREMRRQIGELSRGKRVLNCFGYTGGFSVYAAGGGASEVVTVDISVGALALARENMALNGFEAGPESFVEADLFTYLREEKELPYDVIVLDPPAFAKRKGDVVKACRGYKDLNRLVMEKMPKGALLLTSSCSYHVDAKLFQTVVFQAAVEAGRSARIIGRHRLAADHPINLHHPEGDYLTSLVLVLS